MGVEFELSARPVPGLDLSINGSVLESKFDSDVTTTSGVIIAGIRDGNRLPSVPNFQISASASYSFPIGDRAPTPMSAPRSSMSAAATPSRATRRTIPGPSSTACRSAALRPMRRRSVDLKLPAYDYVNLSAGIDWDNGYGAMIYVTNLFDENALLSFDRERGGRARLGFNVGQPRIIGITLRKRFGPGS